MNNTQFSVHIHVFQFILRSLHICSRIPVTELDIFSQGSFFICYYNEQNKGKGLLLQRKMGAVIIFTDDVRHYYKYREAVQPSSYLLQRFYPSISASIRIRIEDDSVLV